MPENGYAEHSLNGSWLMSEGGDSQPDFSRAVNAQIPCTVQTALFEAGKIPDPMFGKNDKYAREPLIKSGGSKKNLITMEEWQIRVSILTAYAIRRYSI